MMTDGDSDSARQAVFRLLDENPLLTPKQMCFLLKYDYHLIGHYVRSLKYEWKRHHENERGSNGSFPDEVHRVYYTCHVPGGLGRDVLGLGWIPSRSRNRALIWKDGIGRMRWFENGNVELYVRKPANRGKAAQLFCNGFTMTEILSLKQLEECLATLRVRGSHAVFETPKRLPYKKITLFKGTHGVTVITGDRSHPNAIEVIWEYQEQLRKLDDLLNVERNGEPKRLEEDYSR